MHEKRKNIGGGPLTSQGHPTFNFLFGFRPLHFEIMIKRCFFWKSLQKINVKNKALWGHPDMRSGGGGLVPPVPPGCATDRQSQDVLNA